MGDRHEVGLCSLCGVNKRVGRSYCKECRRKAMAVWRAGGSLSTRKKTPRDGPITEMDDCPDQCLSGFWTTTPCFRKATYRSGQWRACAEHRLPGDKPID